MEPLCQEAPTSSFEDVKKSIEKELKVNFDDFFEKFDPVPLGSASIAQVHKARIKGTNKDIAMKIQHPMVYILCPSDVIIVKVATIVAEYAFSNLKLQWIHKEFKRNIMKEINFIYEGQNADKCRNNFKNDETVVIPEVFWNYTTEKILTMSFEEGKSIVDTKYRISNNISVNDIASILTHCFNKQIFEFGFVHSDPHVGNLFIRKEKNKKGKLITKLVLLDHGLYRELNDEFVSAYSQLWRGIFIQNEHVIKDACSKLGVKNSELFVSIVTKKSYYDIMKKNMKYSTKERLNAKCNFDNI